MTFIVPVPGDFRMRAMGDILGMLGRTQRQRAIDSKIAAKKQKAIRKRNALTAVAIGGAAFGGLSALGALSSTTAGVGTATAAIDAAASGAAGSGITSIVGALDAAAIGASVPTALTLGGLGTIGLEALRGSQIASSIGGGVMSLFDSGDGAGAVRGISSINAGLRALQAPRLAANKLAVKRQDAMMKSRQQLVRDDLQQRRAIAKSFNIPLDEFEQGAFDLEMSFGEYADALTEQRGDKKSLKDKLLRDQKTQEGFSKKRIQDEWDRVEGVAQLVGVEPESLFDAAKFFNMDPYQFTGKLQSVYEEDQRRHNFLTTLAEQQTKAAVENADELRGTIDEYDFRPYQNRIAEIQAAGQRMDKLADDPVNFNGIQMTDTGMQRYASLAKQISRLYKGVQKTPPPPTVKSIMQDGRLVMNEKGGWAIALDETNKPIISKFTPDESQQIQKMSANESLLFPDGRTVHTDANGKPGFLDFTTSDELNLQQRLSVRKAAEASIKFQRDMLSEDDKDELGPVSQMDIFNRMEQLERGSSPMSVVTRSERTADFSQFDGLRQQLDERKQVAAPVAPTPTKKDQALDLLSRGVPATQWPAELKKSQKPLLEKLRDDLIVKLKAGMATPADIEQGEIISRLLK